MIAKLLAVILVVTGTSGTLLVLRQQRLEAVHEMSVIHRRLAERETALWLMQSKIAAHTRPDAVRQSLETLGMDWVVIPELPPSVPGSSELGDFSGFSPAYEPIVEPGHRVIEELEE